MSNNTLPITETTMDEYDERGEYESDDSMVIDDPKLDKMINEVYEHFIAILNCYFDYTSKLLRYGKDIKHTLIIIFKDIYNKKLSNHAQKEFYNRKIILILCKWARLELTKERYDIINENFMLKYYLDFC